MRGREGVRNGRRAVGLCVSSAWATSMVVFEAVCGVVDCSVWVRNAEKRKRKKEKGRRGVAGAGGGSGPARRLMPMPQTAGMRQPIVPAEVNICARGATDDGLTLHPLTATPPAIGLVLHPR